jgi:hypothetical protein
MNPLRHRLPCPLAALLLAGCQPVGPATLTPLTVNGHVVGGNLTSGQVDYGDLGGGWSLSSLAGKMRDNRTLAEKLTDDLAVQPGFANIPGVEKLNWPDLRLLPASQRPAFNEKFDSSLAQLRGAVEIARLSPPRPGQEAAHAAAIAAMDESLRELTRQRQNLELAPDEGWEFAKDRMRAAWEKSESAYGTARATGF